MHHNDSGRILAISKTVKSVKSQRCVGQQLRGNNATSCNVTTSSQRWFPPLAGTLNHPITLHFTLLLCAAKHPRSTLRIPGIDRTGVVNRVFSRAERRLGIAIPIAEKEAIVPIPRSTALTSSFNLL